jgi:fatty-acyl-CoA synthase
VVTGFNLADLLERVADTVPERIAVVAGDERCTYAALDERSTRLAHALALQPGDHVGLCLHNSIAHIELMLACFKARAVPVNVNWRYTTQEVDDVARDGDLVRVWGDRDVAAGAVDALVGSGSPDRDFTGRSGDDHYVLFTGGTTGRPKGVVWRHEDIFFAALGGGNPGGPPIGEPGEIVASVRDNPAQRLRAFLPHGDAGPDQFVSLALGPLVHASGQWSALGTLLGGGKVVLYTEPSIDMTSVLALIARERVNACNLVGDASARPLVDALRAQPGRFDVSSLRLLGSGGSILSSEIKVELMQHLPNVLAIVEGIGSSESPAQAVAVTTRDSAAPQTLTFAAKAETIVVDDDLRPIPKGSGIVGRLATGGRVPIGYYKDPERSARTFVEIDGARWSLPGDMATIDADGTVHLLGRGSQCINTGGEKVYPEEVEAVLKGAPGIFDAAVVGVPDDRLGHRVVAIVAPVPGAAAPDLTALQSHCRGQLAGYKLPREIHCVDAVGRTEAGKIDYEWARGVVAAG